ncbi:Serine/threonine-protein kinase 16 [Sparganum proliferum]
MGDSIALAVTSGRIQFPENRDKARIPEEIITLIERMLNVDPKARPTIQDVLGFASSCTKIDCTDRMSETNFSPSDAPSNA